MHTVAAKQFTLGADIGGTNSRIGIIDSNGSVIQKAHFSTRDYQEGEAFATRLATEAQSLMQTVQYESGLDKCEFIGLGIGAPNGNYYTGCIESPPNLAFKGITPIVELLYKRLELPLIRLTNDANAAALGEKTYGAAKDFDDFIMITLGTGLGSGIFVNGRLVYGHDGFAGEVGHITVQPAGRTCGFGRQGSLETYCSATGICRTFHELVAYHGQPTRLDHLSIHEITSRKIAEAADAGDFVCQDVMQTTGKMLGQALASVALVTAPKAFFLFGGPVNAGETLLKPTREAFENHLIPSYKDKISIIPSALPQGDAAILGASALIHAK